MDTGTRTGTTDPLVAFLTDSDATCPACRYALRGCTSSRCPECGVPLHLQVGTLARVSAWWLCAVFGLAVAGLLAFMAMLTLLPRIWDLVQAPQTIQLVHRGFVPSSALPNWWMTIAVTVVTLACGGGLCWLIADRRRFTLLPKPMRVSLGVALLMLPLVLISVMYGYVQLAA